MAKPRVFISSTYYDLKHIRASLDIFVDSFGYEPVLSEKGNIAYTHESALDESCYREAENSDIFVLIVGGRYGSEVSGGDKIPKPTFFERYESITKKEYESATSRDIPVYILIEKGVNSEYQTFLRNKDKTDINYAHVESVNVFHLIEDILSKPRNNPIQTFEKFEDIETWLREQWAGLFRELLRRQSQQQQLSGLTQQVADLKETNETLKKYLEAVMIGSGKDKNSKLIESEEKRLEEVRRIDKLRSNDLIKYISRSYKIDFENIVKAIEKCTDLETFSKLITDGNDNPDLSRLIVTLSRNTVARKDFNDVRAILDLAPIEFKNVEFQGEIQFPPRVIKSPAPNITDTALAAMLREQRMQTIKTLKESLKTKVMPIKKTVATKKVAIKKTTVATKSKKAT